MPDRFICPANPFMDGPCHECEESSDQFGTMICAHYAEGGDLYRCSCDYEPDDPLAQHAPYCRWSGEDEP